jgi:hypothetical protein
LSTFGEDVDPPLPHADSASRHADRAASVLPYLNIGFLLG